MLRDVLWFLTLEEYLCKLLERRKRHVFLALGRADAELLLLFYGSSPTPLLVHGEFLSELF